MRIIFELDIDESQLMEYSEKFQEFIFNKPKVQMMFETSAMIKTHNMSTRIKRDIQYNNIIRALSNNHLTTKQIYYKLKDFKSEANYKQTQRRLAELVVLNKVCVEKLIIKEGGFKNIYWIKQE